MGEQGSKTTYIIGAAEDADIRVDHKKVSSRHARLIRVGRGYVLEDLGSSNGTYVDDQRVTEAPVDETSRISFSRHYTTTLPELLERYGDASGVHIAQKTHAEPRAAAPETATTLRVGAKMIVIGRDPECDVRIDERGVSGRHARVFRNCGRLIVEDVGSANGTRVDGERVAWSIVRAGSVVQIGSQRIRFEHEAVAPGPSIQGAVVDLRGVSVDVVEQGSGRTLRIVQDVSFAVLSGELVGIMGPSGSGKTTLLSTLAGLDAPAGGSLLRVNGAPMYGADGDLAEGLAPRIGFAPQDDVLHALLTVEEEVRYGARLRLSADVGDAEISRRVAAAIDSVGLTKHSGTRIGSVTSKSLSGGERKRVSIAIELATNPTLLLLDEPTSGLSSHDAAELMLLLRRLADEGRTVVLTIHQPSYPMFVQMDRVAILDAGKLAYFGPSGVDVFEFFEVFERQPGALLDRLAEGGKRGTPWPDAFARSDTRERAVVERQRVLDGAPTPSLPAATSKGPLAALAVLVQRDIVMKTRDGFFWIVAVVVPMVVAALFSVVLRSQLDEPGATGDWMSNASLEHTYLVVLTIMVCFFGALSSALEIFYERAPFRRERRGGLGIAPYLGSKAVLYAIPSLTHPAASLLVFLAMGKAMAGSFVPYYQVLVPAFFAAACAGLCLSAALRSAEGVIGLAVAYAIVQTVFSAFAPLSVAVRNGPDGADPPHPWLLWVSSPVTARWSLTGLVTRHDLCGDGAPATGAQSSPEYESCKKSFYRDHAVRSVSTPAERLEEPIWHSVAANGSLALVALIGAGIILRRRPKP
jgi:ABC-type multidrug transport system ATPase subunit/pSer/pThr/pTyr-binding forkhead associated (FHA) protein